MAKSKNLDQKPTSKHRGASAHAFSFGCMKAFRDAHLKKPVVELPPPPPENREWENAQCSVCMESPHNAVLLLCSSYEKGCRPYMCSTSHRYSNCLDQYKRSCDELLCPLCRGQVKGWTVVHHARRHLNSKERACTHDNCSFVGNYKGLRKHVKSEHPLSRPRDVDPAHAERWKKLENERDLSDVFSTIRSAMPGAIVMGDYVIESNVYDDGADYLRLARPQDYEAIYDEESFSWRARRAERLRGQMASRAGRVRGQRASTAGRVRGLAL